MERRFAFFGSLLNLVTLIMGLAIGFLLGAAHSNAVHAQTTQPPVEEIAPVITAGSAAFDTILARRAAIDNISIQGLDLFKFDQNVLNLLASKPLVFSSSDIQQVISDSHSDKILRMKQPTPAQRPEVKKP